MTSILKVLPSPCFYPNFYPIVSSYRLVRQTMKFHKKKITAYYQNTVGIRKYFYRKEMICCYNAAIHVNFLHHLYSHWPGGDGVTPWGPGAASAESCTHPAMRDRCFPPPIAERQRLPNVGIVGRNYTTIPKLHNAAISVWEWISIFLPHFTMDVFTYPLGLR